MSHPLIRFDWAIKKLLCSKANFGILEGFLSELLQQDLKILQLLESESNKDNKDDKQNRVDILVQLQNDEIVLVEIQVEREYDYFHRMLYSTSKIVTQYLQEGEAYANVKKVYSVNILYFDLGHGKDYIYHGTTYFTGVYDHDILDLSERQKVLFKKEFTHQLFPEYYLIKVNQFNDVAKNTLDEWIYFLKNEEVKDSFHAKGLAEVKEKLNELKLSSSERQEYQRFLDNLHYEASMTQYSDYGIAKMEGEKIGIEKGEKIGIKKGEKIGIEKGKMETLHAITIALDMFTQGKSLEEVSQKTGLPLAELEVIKNRIR